MQLVMKRADLLECFVLSTLVKPKLVSLMRSLQAQRKFLKVDLWGSGPCLEAIVIMQLVDELKLVPLLKVEFRSYEEEAAWHAGNSALNVNLTHPKGNLLDIPDCLPFWEEMGQQHNVIAWYAAAIYVQMQATPPKMPAVQDLVCSAIQTPRLSALQ